jgi:hypothetical protein
MPNDRILVEMLSLTGGSFDALESCTIDGLGTVDVVSRLTVDDATDAGDCCAVCRP